MESLNNVLVYAGIIAVIVNILVQVIKNTIVIPKNLVPVLGIVVGVVVGVAGYSFTDLELTLRIWAGIFSGLSAVGLYELTTNRSGNTKEDKKTNTEDKI